MLTELWNKWEVLHSKLGIETSGREWWERQLYKAKVRHWKGQTGLKSRSEASNSLYWTNLNSELICLTVWRKRTRIGLIKA